MIRLAAVLAALAAPAAAQLTLQAPPQAQSPFIEPGSLADPRGVDPRRDDPYLNYERPLGPRREGPAILPRGLVIADPGQTEGSRRGDAPGLGAIIRLD